MNVIDLINEVKDSENSYQEAMARDPMFWAKFVRRHKAGIIDALFLDKDYDIKEEDIRGTIKQVAGFFELPVPVIKEKVETIAEVITSENAVECELYYNWQKMEKSGINNREALKLAFLHELSHQYLYKTRFLLFENELWIQELAADLLVGGFSVLNGDVATGKYKYVVSTQKASLTHPDGKLREEIVAYGREYVEQLLRQKRYNGIKDILTGLPAFVYSHYQELQDSWEAITLEDMMKDEEKPVERPIDYESLPDTNLLKQYWLKHKDDKKKENET
jgi:hypothetical protein